MPVGPKGQKRSADVIGAAVMIGQIATGKIDDLTTEEGKNAATVALGRMGGKARAEGMSAKRRKEIGGKIGRTALIAAVAAIPKSGIIWVEEPMHQAANVQFERAVREFARWRAVPESYRSPAPAWWWGPAFEVIGVQQPMPADWCARLELPGGSSFTDGAEVFLNSLAGQTSLPWPDDFPGRAMHSNPA